MSEKNEEWRKEFKSWRSIYPHLAVHEPNNKEEKFISEFNEKPHVIIDSNRFIGFDGKEHKFNELSEIERIDFMQQNEYMGDKLWKEIEPEQ